MRGQGILTQRHIASLILAALLLLGAASFAHAEGIEIKSAELELVEETYQLNAEAEITLNPTLEDALNKGVPLHFVADFELKKPRWYWLDETISAAQQHIRLSYHALTRQYQLSINSQHKNFPALNEARRELGRISAWPVVKRNLVKEKQSYVAGLRFRLDLTQLPKPLQVNALASKEWDLDSDWFRWTEDRKQKTEDRLQKTEDRGQKTEDKAHKAEDRIQKTEDRGQRTEDRAHKAEDKP
ncbi:MAG: DUF4390 domain-containing protein [Sulfuricellaceae bacterium]